MKRLATILPATILSSLVLASVASASFGLKELDVRFENQDGSTVTQAGEHPFAMTTTVAFNTVFSEKVGFEVPDGDPRNLRIPQMEGLVGNPTVVPPCTNAEFLDQGKCPPSSRVGTNIVEYNVPGETAHVPVFSLETPPGVAMKLGFYVLVVPVTVEIGVNESVPSNVVASLTNISNVLPVYRSELTLWGTPAAKVHDAERGGGVGLSPQPFLTMPRACTGPLKTVFQAESWDKELSEGFAETHDDSEPPQPQGMTGCGNLDFNPTFAAQPTSRAASSATGMDVTLAVDDEGLTNPEGLAASDIRKAVVTLPEGLTANPSLAEGLGVCTEAQLAAETPTSPPGAGCPEAAKVGSVEVETPLLKGHLLQGSLFIAKPHENPFGTLLALYIVIKDPELGIVVRQPLRVEPDPRTGQLVTTAEDIPQLPFSHFRVHLREGGRSPLISPPTCGTHTARAVLTPWAGGPPLTTTSSFEVSVGPNGGACLTGPRRFDPGFEAGTLNNRAGAHSAFHLRLTRADGEQDLTRFSAKLPPGMSAILAGTAQCPEAAIAAAKAKTGLQERATPSCPASSQIGTTITGAGVGSQLTYVPGSLYLAGPVAGAPLSIVAIVPAVAGPFDVGTVVVREALRIDPRSGKVTADGSISDPIPHILAGIPLNVRDVRARVDKPDFMLNPTSCEPFAVESLLWGGGGDVFSSADDSPHGLSARYQASDCAALAFGPRLALTLKGGTKRGDFPALTGIYTPRRGDANLQGLVLRLPRSAFLEQSHIRTICTRVQFAAKACPPGAIYGRAKAWTPILEAPLEGPVYLRASSNPLPDFVADLRGLVDVEAVAKIDSRNGAIRATFAEVPDAPLSRVVVRMQGGKKGLIVNSTDLCARRQSASASFTAHNGRRHAVRPQVRAVGCKKGAGKRPGAQRRG